MAARQPWAATTRATVSSGRPSRIARLEGVEAAHSAIHYVAPVGEKEAYVTRAMANISPFL